MDACGDLNSLQPVLQSGAHFSSLMVNFRSNRRNTGMDFFLAITCTLPLEASVTNGRSSNHASTASIAPLSADKSLSRDGTECTRTRSLSGAIVGTDPSQFISARQYIVSNIIIIVCLLITYLDIVFCILIDCLYHYTTIRGISSAVIPLIAIV